MTQPNITIFKTPEILAEAVAERFLDWAHAGLEKTGRFAVALSGGSTPKRMYKVLTRLAQTPSAPSVPSVLSLLNRIDYFWGDERQVPPDHPDSNYRAARDALFQPLELDEDRIHRIPAELPDPAEAARQYEQTLRDYFGGEPRFDLIFLGMGPDGHTASIFPGTTAVTETTARVTAPWVEKLNTHRITLTYPTINQAAKIVFLITGSDKKDALNSVLYGETDLNTFPSQGIAPENGALFWYLDPAAAP